MVHVEILFCERLGDPSRLQSAKQNNEAFILLEVVRQLRLHKALLYPVSSPTTSVAIAITFNQMFQPIRGSPISW